MAAIRGHLAGIPGLPDIVWPNEAKKVTPPFLTFDLGPSATSSITIDGEERVEVRPLVSVVVKDGTYTTAQDDLMWSIAQAFKIGTRIAYGAGKHIQSLRTPEPDNGFVDGNMFKRGMLLRISADHTL